jgi:hypothetical protein
MLLFLLSTLFLFIQPLPTNSLILTNTRVQSSNLETWFKLIQKNHTKFQPLSNLFTLTNSNTNKLLSSCTSSEMKQLLSTLDDDLKYLLGCPPPPPVVVATTDKSMNQIQQNIAQAKTNADRIKILISLLSTAATATATAASGVVQQKNPDDDVQKLVKEIMKDALASAKFNNEQLSFDSSLQVTGKLITACSLHKDCIEKHILGEELLGIGNYLIHGLNTVVVVQSPTTTDDHQILDGISSVLGLRALESYIQSLTISPEQIVSSSSSTDPSNQQVMVSLTNLLGQPSMNKWTLYNAPSGVTMLDGNTLQIDSSKAMKTGTFTITFEVNKVQTTRVLSLPKFQITCIKSSLAILQRTGRKDFDGVEYPSTLKIKVKAEESDVIEFSTQIVKKNDDDDDVTSSPPGIRLLLLDQVMLRVYHVQLQREYFLMPSSVSGNEYKFNLAIGNTMIPLQYTSNEQYSLSLIVSDATVEPLQWILLDSSLSISFTRSGLEKKHLPLFKKHLLYESDSTLSALPEIHHQFRPEARRAPILVAILVSLFLIGLLMIFLVGVTYLGFTGLVIKTIVLSPLIWLVLAHIVLFTWYWIGLFSAPNFVDMVLFYLPPLTLSLIFFIRRHAYSGSSGSDSDVGGKKNE